jgi:hypothetical protein
MSRGVPSVRMWHPLWFPFDPGEVRDVGGDEIGALLKLNGELTCA